MKKMKRWGWSPECEELKRDRQFWWAKVRKWRSRSAKGTSQSASRELHLAMVEYNAADRRLAKKISKTRETCWLQAIGKFNVDTPTGEMWKQHKRLMGQNTHKKPHSSIKYTALPLRDAHNKVILDPPTQAEALGDWWSDVARRSSDHTGSLPTNSSFCRRNHQKVMSEVKSWE